MYVKDYEIIGKLTTDNSGTAKWGFAKKGAETVFIKEFLTPVYPTDENSFTPKAIETAKSICAEFEREKKRLYDSLKECKGGGIVYPTDFFRFKSKYYMITPKIEMSSITIEEISKLDINTKIMICKVIAYNMIAIHKKRIIHADIKPNNVLIKKTITGTYTAKIIISFILLCSTISFLQPQRLHIVAPLGNSLPHLTQFILCPPLQICMC